jgi:hypothetical protein
MSFIRRNEGGALPVYHYPPCCVAGRPSSWGEPVREHVMPLEDLVERNPIHKAPEANAQQNACGRRSLAVFWCLHTGFPALKRFAQFLAVCRSSILAEMLGYAASFSSPWRGKRRVVERRKSLFMDQLQPSTNSDKLSDPLIRDQPGSHNERNTPQTLQPGARRRPLRPRGDRTSPGAGAQGWHGNCLKGYSRITFIALLRL